MFNKKIPFTKSPLALAGPALSAASHLPELGKLAVNRLPIGRDRPSKWPWVAAAWAVGLATGAGVALLVAPTSGVRTRERIKEKAKGATSRTLDKVRRKESDDAGRLEAGSETTPSFDDVTKSELYEEARAQGIPGRSTMDKQELAEALHGS